MSYALYTVMKPLTVNQALNKGLTSEQIRLEIEHWEQVKMDAHFRLFWLGLLGHKKVGEKEENS
jgi:hypothetical protein